MKLIIDTQDKTLSIEKNERSETLDLYSKEAFEIISAQWLKVGWNQKHTYTFSWLGRPIIQLPEDMVRIQELIYSVKPDVIVETGIAHGGSLIFYASLFKAMSKGRVIGVDIEIRPHNLKAIEEHELFPFITLIEGSSIKPETIDQVLSLIHPGEKVMVILDSNHTKKHVIAELEAYSPLVSVDSYIVATDGIMRDLHDVPRGQPEWEEDNPSAAALEFVSRHPEFIIEQPHWPFNESDLENNITHWPNAYLRREK
ncbi:MAG: CmcI family methyltransferase [Lentisphaerae bacterium]|nr:CmcI family methyltransferase [Lentisphaerota bacterium]